MCVIYELKSTSLRRVDEPVYVGDAVIRMQTNLAPNFYFGGLWRPPTTFASFFLVRSL